MSKVVRMIVRFLEELNNTLKDYLVPKGYHINGKLDRVQDELEKILKDRL